MRETCEVGLAPAVVRPLTLETIAWAAGHFYAYAEGFLLKAALEICEVGVAPAVRLLTLEPIASLGGGPFFVPFGPDTPC